MFLFIYFLFFLHSFVLVLELVQGAGWTKHDKRNEISLQNFNCYMSLSQVRCNFTVIIEAIAWKNGGDRQPRTWNTIIIDIY